MKRSVLNRFVGHLWAANGVLLAGLMFLGREVLPEDALLVVGVLSAASLTLGIRYWRM